VLPMLLVDWRRISSPQRAKRLSLGSAVWVGLLGTISAAIFGQDPVIVAAVLAGTSLVLQAHSSFGNAPQPVPVAEKRAMKAQQNKSEKQSGSGVACKHVPPYVLALWLVGFLAALGLGLFLTILYASGGLRGDDAVFTLAFGVDSFILSLFCFVGIFRHRFKGWYRYIIKPAILLVCVQIVVFSSICMGNLQLDDEWFFAFLASIIIPAIAFFVIAILPASLFAGPVTTTSAPLPRPAKIHAPAGVSSFKRFWALLLAIPGLVPVLGIPLAGLQRFYVGKIGTGILWFLTGGVFLIGQLIDVIMILSGQFKDRYGMPLVIWHNESEPDARKVGFKPAGQRSTPVHDVAAAASQPVEKVHPAEDSPKPPSRPVPTTTVVYEPFHPLAFLFSGIGFILVFIAIVVGLAVSLHTPYLVAAGVLFAGVFFLVSVVILAWPARHKQIMLTPALNQGVS
jgi:hypothetical protein